MADVWVNRNRNLLEFMKHNARKREALGVKRSCQEFLKFISTSSSSQETRSLHALEKQFARNGHRIQELNYDIKDRILMMFSLRLVLNSWFLNEIRKTATVNLDKKGRIAFYETHDGSMKLQTTCFAREEDREATRQQVQDDAFFNDLEQYEYGGDLVQDTLNEPSSSSRLNSVVRVISEDPREECHQKFNPNMYREASEFSTPLPTKMPKYEETIMLAPKPEPGLHQQITPESFVKAENSEEPISVIELLKQLESLVGTLDSPHLSQIRSRIQENITQPRLQQLTVGTRTIKMSLELALDYVVRNATLTASDETSTSLRDFLLIFRAITFQIADFSGALNRISNDLGFSQKRVPFQKIQLALEYATGFVLP